jgi:hypothetical protein
MSENILTLSSDVVVTVLEDGAVLLELQTKFFYSVNASGWAIVQMLENGASRQQVLDKCANWGAPADHTDGIHAFLDLFEKDCLVDVASGDTMDITLSLDGSWVMPTVDKHKEPLQKIMVSAFDPSLPLAE